MSPLNWFKKPQKRATSCSIHDKNCRVEDGKNQR
jgi:hypothetical protein